VTPTSLADLRRFAVHRSLFAPTTLRGALQKLGFVQADPIRAPARAQDLTLRHRVAGYRAGDLERRYADLDVEEEVFINYGFVTRPVQALIQPRGARAGRSAAPREEARTLLTFVRARGAVHPRQADDHFARGTVTNYWGGSSSATTHLLEDLHYRGFLRVARREQGIRVYAASDHPRLAGGRAARQARIDALVDVVVHKYAPLTARGLARVVRRLRYAVPQWAADIDAGLRRAATRLSQTRVDGIVWYWPAGERLAPRPPRERVRLLSPFDPVVWDRDRFEMFWGWPYRFEAYTPAAKRQRGYYALPLLWRDRVIGWGNLSVKDGRLRTELGYVDAAPPDRAFARELDAELHRMRVFLGVEAVDA
jgi:uncharacterized protein YcaQ